MPEGKPGPKLIVGLDPLCEQGGKRDSKERKFGVYFVRVSFVDEQGHYTKGEEVTISAKGYDERVCGAATRETDTIESSESPKRDQWYHTFMFIPKSAGKKKLTFSCNGISQSIDIQAK